VERVVPGTRVEAPVSDGHRRRGGVRQDVGPGDRAVGGPQGLDLASGRRHVQAVADGDRRDGQPGRSRTLVVARDRRQPLFGPVTHVVGVDPTGSRRGVDGVVGDDRRRPDPVRDAGGPLLLAGFRVECAQCVVVRADVHGPVDDRRRREHRRVGLERPQFGPVDRAHCRHEPAVARDVDGAVGHGGRRLDEAAGVVGPALGAVRRDGVEPTVVVAGVDRVRPHCRRRVEHALVLARQRPLLGPVGRVERVQRLRDPDVDAPVGDGRRHGGLPEIDGPLSGPVARVDGVHAVQVAEVHRPVGDNRRAAYPVVLVGRFVLPGLDGPRDRRRTVRCVSRVCRVQSERRPRVGIRGRPRVDRRPGGGRSGARSDRDQSGGCPENAPPGQAVGHQSP